MKTHILLILSFLITPQLFAQNSNLDSLKNILQTNLHDTTRLDIVNQILHLVAPQKRVYYNNKMIALAEDCLKNNKDNRLAKVFLFYAAEGYYNRSVFFSNESKTDSAIIAVQKSIELNTMLNRTQQLADSYVALGSLYAGQGNYLEATDLFYKSIPLFEKIEVFEGLGDVYANIARVYYAQDNYSKTIVFLNDAIKYYEKAKYAPGVIEVLNKLATVYIAKDDKVQAINTLERAINVVKKEYIEAGTYYEEMYYANLGNLNFLKKEMELSIQFYEKSIEVAYQTGNIYVIGHRKFDIGRAYFNLKDYPKALVLGKEALQLAQEMELKDLEASVTRFLSEVYERLNNYQQAYLMQKTFLALQEAVRKEKDEKQIIEQQFKYEYEKKELLATAQQEKKILELNLLAKQRDARKNLWIVILLISVIIIAIAAYFIYQYQRQKNTIEIQHSNLLKQKLLLSQMNPHFIFNSLNAIQNFIIKNNSLQASIYLSKFSEMIRMILNFSRKDYITLESELKFLDYYLELQQLRSEHHFDYSFKIEDDLETDTILVPPMLAQPFIENAVEHGGFNAERKGHISVSFSIQNEQLICVIEDDGIGLEKSAIQRSAQFEKHESLATKITQERMETLFGTDGKTVQINIIDKKNLSPSATGVKVSFAIPLKAV